MDGKKKKNNAQAVAEPNVEQVSRKKRLPRAVKIIAKVSLLWIPLFLICFLAVLLLTLEFYLTEERVEKLVISRFNSLSNGSIELSVKEFSLWHGFVIEQLRIHNSEAFSRSKCVEIDKIVLQYGLFDLLRGNIHFDEIGIYRPRIYLSEKNGVYNIQTLMKSSPSEPARERKSAETTVQEPEKDKTPRKEITLPLAVQFFLKFVLEDLNVYVNSESFTAKMEGLSCTVDVDVPPFKTVPLSLRAAQLLDKVKIMVNPDKTLDVSFHSRDVAAELPLIFSWNVLFDRNGHGNPAFKSAFSFGTYKAPVRFKNAHLAPLHFMVRYDMQYDPLKDYLDLRSCSLSFRSKKLIECKGAVSRVTRDPYFDLKMAEGAIDLDDLYPYYLSLTHDRHTRFNGDISFKPLTIKGNTRNLKVDGTLSLSRLYVKNNDVVISIPRGMLRYAAAMEGGTMRGSADLFLPHFWYQLHRNRSGDNGVRLQCELTAHNNFNSVNLTKFDVAYYDPITKEKCLTLAMKGSLRNTSGLTADLSVPRLKFYKTPLERMLPRNLKRLLRPVPFQKPVYLHADLNLNQKGGIIGSNFRLGLQVPEYSLTDVTLISSVLFHQSQKRLTVKKFSLGSKEKGIEAAVQGSLSLDKPPFSEADLLATLSMDYPRLTRVYGPWQVSGKAEVRAAMKGDLTTGKIEGSVAVRDLFLENREDMLSIEKVDLRFPYVYDFAYAHQEGSSRISVDKSRIIENMNFEEKVNFSIASVKAKHPARKKQFEYMKDFSASMFFRNNAFEIPKLKATVLDGTMYGRNILYYLADLRLDNMEYNLVLDVTNLDVGRLDDTSGKKKSRDAELSLNVNVSGKGVNIRKEFAPTGNVNVYKVGEKFANKLMKGLSETKGKSKLGPVLQYVVDHLYEIKGFYFYLDFGLVYPTIKLKPALFGRVVSIENDEVKIERMPLMEYLRKVREGEEERDEL